MFLRRKPENTALPFGSLHPKWHSYFFKSTLLVTMVSVSHVAHSVETGVYQKYQVPMPENIVTDFNNTVNNAGNEINTVLSISVVLDGTRIWFDHSEDGQENFLTNPTQPTTGVWGDGDPSNGFAPGFPADVLSAGDVIVLDQIYDVTTVGSCTYSDGTGTDCRLNGGDRFGSNKALAVTRAAWNTAPGSVLAGAIEVESLAYWDTQYTLPLGEQGNGTSFETVWAVVNATEDDTDVQLNGGTVITLQAGESHAFQNTQAGDQITANYPVQVNLLTGTDETYESRWYRVSSISQWSGEYYSPVGGTSGTDVSYYLYNPGNDAIDVEISNTSGLVTTLSLAANGSGSYTFNSSNSSYHFKSAGNEPFYVVGSIEGATYDWGFSLVPAEGLTGQTVVGWAPGDLTRTNANYSPVWVTAVDDTTLCVDYDRDGAVDLTQPINRLEMIRLADVADQDMTGALIYSINDIDGDNASVCTTNGVDDTQTDIAVVWGQDPQFASGGSPALDLGTTVLPVPKYAVSKRAELFNDADGSGNITPGDTVKYIIEVDNYGALPLNNAMLTDNMPADLTVVPAESHPDWDCSNAPECTLGTFAVPQFTSVSFDLAALIPGSGNTATVANNTVTLNPGTGDPETTAEAEAPIEYADITTQLDFPSTVLPGASVTGYVAFGNVGTLTATNTIYQIELPAGLSGVGCTGATCVYDSATGVVTVTGLPTSLSSGQWTDLVTLGFTAPAIGTSISLESNIATTSLQPSPHEPDVDNTVVNLSAEGSSEADVISRVNPPAIATPGSTVTVPVTYTNFGSATANVSSYQLTLPPGLTGVTCTAVTCNYNDITGVVSITGLPVSLASGENVGFNLSYIAPSAGSVTTGSDISSGDETNTANNPDTKSTLITGAALADVSTRVSPPSAANAGEVVTVPVRYSNVGANDATGITYNLMLTQSPTNVVVMNGAATCAYDSNTGNVTGCGLPGTLTPGQVLDLILSYTAPVTSPVVITSTIGTDATETSVLNNIASAESQVSGNDMVVDISGLSHPGAGMPYEGYFSCTNQGDAPASINTTCEILNLPAGLTTSECRINGVNWSAGDSVPAGSIVRCGVTGTTTELGEVSLEGRTTADGDVDLSNNQDSRSLSVRSVSTSPIPVFGPWGLLATISALLVVAWRRKMYFLAN